VSIYHQNRWLKVPNKPRYDISYLLCLLGEIHLSV
jgi:hypothetical protein